MDVLEAQAADRLADLVPVRYGRMLASPFAFFRGAAAVMAMDLATLPRTPLRVQLCGDAHLLNFGVYGSPERELVFDINDFDETLEGPFEWDLKRLATSIVVAGAGQAASVRPSAARPRSRPPPRTAERCGASPAWARSRSGTTALTVDDVIRILDSRGARKWAVDWIRRARSNTSMKALNTLTRVVDGWHTIVDDPPLIEHLPPAEGADLAAEIRHDRDGYRHSLTPDRRHLLDQFRTLDIARKVVGVGSVGTRCYVLVLQGRTADDPLFLQIKEAQASVLEPYLGKSPYRDHGERVVVGQRWMQAASDIFLGWFQDEGGRRLLRPPAGGPEGLACRSSRSCRRGCSCTPGCAGGRSPAPTPAPATASRSPATSGPAPASTRRWSTSPRRTPTRTSATSGRSWPRPESGRIKAVLGK